MNNFLENLKRYGIFNPAEVRAILLTILFLVIIVALNDGRPEFQLGPWLSNLFLMTAIVVVSVLVKQAGYRLVGIHYGFRVEYKLWWYGIIVSLAITLLSGGTVWILIPGGIILHHMKIQRLGEFRYGTNIRTLALVSAAGPLFNVLFATGVKSLGMIGFLPSLVVDKIFLFNLAFAAYSMLPIPPLDGSKVMYDSRLIYMFVTSFIILYAILAYFDVYSYLIALTGAIAVWLLYYMYFE
ncbi:MAG: hypothetical protein ACLFP2_00780 [Candidatus Woesearchaeota archaeon]